jgi:hypothetical protein
MGLNRYRKSIPLACVTWGSKSHKQKIRSKVQLDVLVINFSSKLLFLQSFASWKLQQTACDACKIQYDANIFGFDTSSGGILFFVTAVKTLLLLFPPESHIPILPSPTQCTIPNTTTTHDLRFLGGAQQQQ